MYGFLLFLQSLIFWERTVRSFCASSFNVFIIPLIDGKTFTTLDLSLNMQISSFSNILVNVMMKLFLGMFPELLSNDDMIVSIVMLCIYVVCLFLHKAYIIIIILCYLMETYSKCISLEQKPILFQEG